jgi:hypothetical protein
MAMGRCSGEQPRMIAPLCSSRKPCSGAAAPGQAVPEASRRCIVSRSRAAFQRLGRGFSLAAPSPACRPSPSCPPPESTSIAPSPLARSWAGPAMPRGRLYLDIKVRRHGARLLPRRQAAHRLTTAAPPTTAAPLVPAASGRREDGRAARLPAARRPPGWGALRCCPALRAATARQQPLGSSSPAARPRAAAPAAGEPVVLLSTPIGQEGVAVLADEVPPDMEGVRLVSG